jgi:DNA-binding response OmpR family regulator
MPILDGFHVLEAIQKVEKRPYVIVLSNLSQHEDESKVIAMGADKYFIKSNTSLAELVAEIQKL